MNRFIDLTPIKSLKIAGVSLALLVSLLGTEFSGVAAEKQKQSHSSFFGSRLSRFATKLGIKSSKTAQPSPASSSTNSAPSSKPPTVSHSEPSRSAPLKQENTWCFNPNLPIPCDGAPGKCVRNSNGSKGGFVADAATLQEGKWLGFVKRKAYVGRDAQVCGGTVAPGARIEDRAIVLGGNIKGNVKISGESVIKGNSILDGTDGKVLISGKAKIKDSEIRDRASVSGKAQIISSTLSQKAKISGSPTIQDSVIAGKSQVGETAKVLHSWLFGNAQVLGNASVKDSKITDDAQVRGGAKVKLSHLSGKAQAYDSAKVIDSELSGTTRVFSQGAIHGAKFSDNTIITIPMVTERFFREGPAEVPSYAQESAERSGETCTDPKKEVLNEVAGHNLDEAFKALSRISNSHAHTNPHGQFDTLVDQFCNTDDRTCQICANPFSELNAASLTPCGHLYCHNCVANIFKQVEDKNTRRASLYAHNPPPLEPTLCPMCRGELTKDTNLNVTRSR